MIIIGESTNHRIVSTTYISTYTLLHQWGRDFCERLYWRNIGVWSRELGKTGRNEWTTLRISKKAETHTYRWPSIRPILIRCCNYKSSQIVWLPDPSSLYVFNAIQFVEVIFTWRVESPYGLRWGFGAVLPERQTWGAEISLSFWTGILEPFG
jgi:hypothetical protein